MNGAGRSRRRGQRGHLMAGVMAAIAIMMIWSTVAFQAWEDVLHRDNEAEMIFRAQDIVRSIQRYRQDNGGLGPEKLDQLMEPGPKGQYYMRRLYEDPLVKEGGWGLLYAGPGGQIVDPNAQPPGEEEGGLGSSFFDQNKNNNQGGSQGSAQQQQVGQQVAGQAGQPQSGFQQNVGGLGQTGSAGAGGQQIAGLRIAGVKSLSTDKPFRIYKGFSEYSQWLFTYFDLEAAAQLGGAAGGPGAAGQQPGQNQAAPPRQGGGRGAFGGGGVGRSGGSSAGGRGGGSSAGRGGGFSGTRPGSGSSGGTTRRPGG